MSESTEHIPVSDVTRSEYTVLSATTHAADEVHALLTRGLVVQAIHIRGCAACVLGEVLLQQGGFVCATERDSKGFTGTAYSESAVARVHIHQRHGAQSLIADSLMLN